VPAAGSSLPGCRLRLRSSPAVRCPPFPSPLSRPGLAAGARVPGGRHPADAADRPTERWPGPTSCGPPQCQDGPRTRRPGRRHNVLSCSPPTDWFLPRCHGCSPGRGGRSS
jgi:hypothetical protein